jgi:hypothetical protein
MRMHKDGVSQGTDLGEMLGILADLTEAGCAVWVAGGWGCRRIGWSADAA